MNQKHKTFDIYLEDSDIDAIACALSILPDYPDNEITAIFPMNTLIATGATNALSKLLTDRPFNKKEHITISIAIFLAQKSLQGLIELPEDLRSDLSQYSFTINKLYTRALPMFKNHLPDELL